MTDAHSTKGGQMDVGFARAWLSEDQQRLLEALIHHDNLQTRDGRSNKKFKYIGKEYVSDVLDQVFGPGGWSRGTKEFETVDSEEQDGRITVYDGTRRVEKDGKNYAVTIRCTVRIEVMLESADGRTRTVVREGTGLDTNNGPLVSITSRGDILATAFKSAESDAFKRAAASLGYALGRNIKESGQERLNTTPRPEGAAAPAPSRQPQTPTSAPAARPAQPATRPAASTVTNGSGQAAAAPSSARPATVTTVRQHVDHGERAGAVKAEPAKAAIQAVAPAETTKPEPVAGSTQPTRSAANWKSHLQNLFSEVNNCADDAALENVAKQIDMIRADCSRNATYGVWFNTVIEKLVEQSETVSANSALTSRYRGMTVNVDEAA